MRYGSIYLIVKDFEKSVSFYEKVLDMKVSATNGKRFAMFHNEGLNLCLMNGYYDDENKSQVITKGDYWYFTFMDPDGNPIEITGGYTEEK